MFPRPHAGLMPEVNYHRVSNPARGCRQQEQNAEIYHSKGQPRAVFFCENNSDAGRPDGVRARGGGAPPRAVPFVFPTAVHSRPISGARASACQRWFRYKDFRVYQRKNKIFLVHNKAIRAEIQTFPWVSDSALVEHERTETATSKHSAGVTYGTFFSLSLSFSFAFSFSLFLVSHSGRSSPHFVGAGGGRGRERERRTGWDDEEPRPSQRAQRARHVCFAVQYAKNPAQAKCTRMKPTR
ncbi:hypothetical protein EVAR_83388_1 [Eumeta japonica]|uniref:Uncharacterized protein n=1 Tax=Eumeta variegata TaxID=151549 RepID=A0A4C1TZN9_EUMVA|nr:hypothetical protein EVAR_83388_1 [Eumeta japonica]